MSSTIVTSIDGVPYGPVRVVSSDTNAALPAAILTNSSRSAIRAVITCEAFAIRYAFGGIIPVTGATEVGHVLAANATLVIGHPAGVTSFRYVTHTSGSNATLQITGEYQP